MLSCHHPGTTCQPQTAPKISQTAPGGPGRRGRSTPARDGTSRKVSPVGTGGPCPPQHPQEAKLSPKPVPKTCPLCWWLFPMDRGCLAREGCELPGLQVVPLSPLQVSPNLQKAKAGSGVSALPISRALIAVSAAH